MFSRKKKEKKDASKNSFLMKELKSLKTKKKKSMNLDEDIAKKAYELFEDRGGENGYDQEDWFTAEKMFK